MSSEQDRELLELAAEAIGLTLEYNYLGLRSANQPWDPLEDDGDALRLAVELQLSVLFYPNSHVDVVAQNILEDGDLCATEGYDADPLAATRRAITRAAAGVSAWNTRAAAALAKGEGK